MDARLLLQRMCSAGLSVSRSEFGRLTLETQAVS
jgi:hypothetical protein